MLTLAEYNPALHLGPDTEDYGGRDRSRLTLILPTLAVGLKMGLCVSFSGGRATHLMLLGPMGQLHSQCSGAIRACGVLRDIRDQTRGLASTRCVSAT